MESHSMRRRQTVLGEQLAAANSSQSLNTVGSSSSLQVPGQVASSSQSAGSNGVRSHMRSFSRLSTRYDVDPDFQLDQHSTQSASKSSVHNSQLSVHGEKPMGNGFNKSNQSLVGHEAQSHGDSIDLLDPDLVNSRVDPLSYLSRNFAGADAAALLSFGAKLRAQTQKATESESKSVQRNYKALRAVANGVAELPVAVAELDKQISELSAVTDAMRQDATQNMMENHIGGGGGPHTPSRNNKRQSTGNDRDIEDLNEGSGRLAVRQSMLVLNNTWIKDLNSLYQRVNGAQKALPPAPGRHLVLEENGWLLLNLVTQKPVKPVLLILLNDFFMVAAPQHGRYMYDSHYALEERLKCEIDESSRVLRVKTGSTQTVLLAPSVSRLRVVYKELTKLNELTVVSKQKVSSLARVRASGSYSLDDHATNQKHGRSFSNSNNGHSRKISVSSVSSTQEATIEERREASKVVASIDRSIAHRKWDSAVDMVIHYRNDTILRGAIDQRHQALCETLINELTAFWKRNSREETSLLIKLLVKLGLENQAKSTLLETSAEGIEQQSRSVNFMGDVVSYISQMAAIYFQTIIATVKVYQLAFPEKSDSSRITAWVKSQVDLFAAIFNRHLFRIAPEFKAYQRCKEVSQLESSQLKQLKMDMEFMLRYVWEK